MKKLTAVLLALLMAAVCTMALAEGEQDALAKLKEKGTLVIGMEGNWSPWTYHDEKTGELTGLEVDIAKLIAEGLGVEPVFQEAPWDALLAGVDAGRFDIICNGVGYTEERAKSYSFTTPYVYSNKVLVVAENNEEIKTVQVLAGDPVAYPVAKDGTESLVEAINEILEAARQDGTLAEISIKYFGVDTTKAE